MILTSLRPAILDRYMNSLDFKLIICDLMALATQGHPVNPIMRDT